MWINSSQECFNRGMYRIKDNLTACMHCYELKWVPENVFCERCDAWYHKCCGIQTKRTMFHCPTCNDVQPLNNKVGRHKKKKSK